MELDQYWQSALISQGGICCRVRMIARRIVMYSYFDTSSVPIQLSELQRLYQEVEDMKIALRQMIETVESDDDLDQPLTINEPSFDKKKFLTEREIEVLSLLSKGMSYRETANVLKCAISTVQTHIKRIYKKLGVHSRSEAVYEFQSIGVLSK